MVLFQKTYIYVFVCFPNGKQPYAYRTADRSITVNTVVMVPVGNEVRPAIVTGVREYKEKDVPYPLEMTKPILGRVDRKASRGFRGIDMRMPYDISVKTVRIPGGFATVVTDKAERKAARQYCRGRKDLRLIETHPVSQAGRIVSRDNNGKRIKKTKWIKEEHLWKGVTYRCLSCGAVFRNPTPFCPACGAEAKGIKGDPVWVEEMEFYDYMFE